MGQTLHHLHDPSPRDLGATPEEMLERFGGPTVVRCSGRDSSRCRVVTTLLHGNEPSGAEAIYEWLREAPEPAVDAVFIFASVEVALHEPRFTHRMMPGERDLNRCFLGPFDDANGQLAQRILAEIERCRPECVIDNHNNTGHNPPYAIATRVEPDYLRLASLFAERFVHSDLRIGSLMEAVTEVPCVTIECGRVGDPRAARTTRRGIDRLFGLAHLSEIGESTSSLQVLESMVRVRARSGLRLAVDKGNHPEADLTISDDIDRHNFETLPAGTRIGWVRPGVDWPVEARDADGADRSRDLFSVNRGELLARRDWIPIMMTTDPLIARQDCLFYVVERGLTRTPRGA